MADTSRKPVESPRALSAGLTFAAAVAMFALGGNWLDDRLGTQPLCILLGMLLGMVGGTLHLLRVLAPATLPFRQKKKDDDSSK